MEVRDPLFSLGLVLNGHTAAKQLIAPVRWGERIDPGVRQVIRTLRYPRFIKNAYAWIIRHIYKDPMWADLVSGCTEKTVDEEWHLTVRRDKYRKQFHDAWNDAKFDLLLTVPNSIPAIPKDGMEEATVANCSYVFLFNVVSTMKWISSQLLTHQLF